MSPKQQIYHDFLMWTLAYIRNVQSQPFWRRWRDRSVYEEAELIHNLCHSILETEFVPHDLSFLNVQAASYHERTRFSPLYSQQIERIRELFTLVPAHMRAKLQWKGP